MPVELVIADRMVRVSPSSQWQTLACPDQAENVRVATDRFYINVEIDGEKN
jgi:hypothetical protein